MENKNEEENGTTVSRDEKPIVENVKSEIEVINNRNESKKRKI